MRLVDVVVAAAGLIALGPTMFGLAWLIRRDSPGPALHRPERIGLREKPFTMLKFRTMVANAAKIGPGITYRNDPRITRLGRYLRATKLDEVPQLWNVLRGEMSLVGPRPEAPDYVALYPEDLRCVVRDIKPGIFGISQLRFRDEERRLGPNVHDEYVAGAMKQKLLLDRDYVRRKSVGLDLALLLRGAAAVVRG